MDATRESVTGPRVEAVETAAVKPGPADTSPPMTTPAAALRTDITVGEVDWLALIVESGLRGMVRELAQHCEWVGLANGVVALRLGEAQKHLLAQQSRLQTELSRHFDQSLKLRIEVGEIDGETPAQRNAAVREQRHADAVASLAQDPFVQEMIERFDATLQESSVRPL